MAHDSFKLALQSRRLRLSAVARMLGVDKGTLTKWNLQRVPAERVLEVERVTGISRHELRPDIYPPDEGAPASSPAAPSETTGN